ncbi:MAG TPA: hypothetical protein VNZ57_05130, partial [Longimicrobiales bacterium]|nr:hypothetical protein [Longimicrobiales bacterium]
MFSIPSRILAATVVFVVACGVTPRPEPAPSPNTDTDTVAGVATDRPVTPGAEGDGVAARGGEGIAPPRMVVADAQKLMLDVLGEVNASRARVGARPLGIDPGLLRAARRYSEELAARRLISHVSLWPDRRTFRQRI